MSLQKEFDIMAVTLKTLFSKPLFDSITEIKLTKPASFLKCTFVSG